VTDRDSVVDQLDIRPDDRVLEIAKSPHFAGFSSYRRLRVPAPG
jgi:hypothetical protein